MLVALKGSRVRARKGFREQGFKYVHLHTVLNVIMMCVS